MLRETRTETPRKRGLCLTLKVRHNQGHTMEIIEAAHDLVFVLLLIAIAMAPRALATYLALRKGE